MLEALNDTSVINRLADEHEAVFGRESLNGTIPSLDTCRKLKFAPMCLREALRKYNVVPLVMREVVSDDTIPAAESGLSHDITVRKGAVVAVGLQAIHSDARYWPEPDAFRPERFADMDAVDQWAFIPFINGPRNCLGQHLSLLETQIVLSFVAFHLRDMKLRMPRERAATKHPYIVPVTPVDGMLVSAN
jgi:cytochrome P450